MLVIDDDAAQRSRLSRMIRQMGTTPGVPTDRGLSAFELQRVAVHADSRLWPDGGAVFRAGDPGSAMFLVQSGEVELVLDGGARRVLVGPGEFFGELALLLSGTGRSGDAVARPGARLLELDEPGFANLRAAHPELAVALVVRSARSLLASERRLVNELEARNRELERTLDYLRRTREELSSAELQAQTDALTGLYNRRCLDRQMPRVIRRAEESGTGLALILVDLDRFKHINDTWGHPAGDAVLCAVAAGMRSAVRSSDLPCRIGGDEFAAVLVDLPSPEVAAARVREVFRSAGIVRVELAGESVTVGTSHGGALLQPGEDFAALLSRADAFLYAAKTRGRGTLVWEGEPVLTGAR